jgi:predicted permease
MQLSFEGWREELPLLSLGLGYKLLLAPALIVVLALFLHTLGIVAQVSIFEAAMAPMTTAGVLAAQYDLNPRLANLTVGIGILLSFLTTAIWYGIMNYLPMF